MINREIEVQVIILLKYLGRENRESIFSTAHGETQEKAIQEIREAVRVHLLMLIEYGDEIPQYKSIMASI